MGANGEVQSMNCGPGKTCVNMKKYWRDDRHNIRGSSGKYTAVICTNMIFSLLKINPCQTLF